MARIRSIKPEFWTDEDLSALPPETHLLAAALLNHADDEGYFNAHPKLVEAACCPLREDSTSIRRSLDELSRIGYIELYEGTDGKEYGCIRNFAKHQRVDRPNKSKIRPIISHLRTFDEDSTSDRRGLDEDSTPDQGTGIRDQGTGIRDQGGDSHRAPTGAPRTGGNGHAQHFDAFWLAYPIKRDKKKAREVWMRKRLDERADTILADVRERMRTDDQWRRGYVPLPTTYLRGERWDDEYTRSESPTATPAQSDPFSLNNEFGPDWHGRWPKNDDGTPNPDYRDGDFWKQDEHGDYYLDR